MLVLHPRYKTRYFASEGWEKEWVDNATNLLRENWDKYYKGSATQQTSVPAPRAKGSSNVRVRTYP